MRSNPFGWAAIMVIIWVASAVLDETPVGPRVIVANIWIAAAFIMIAIEDRGTVK